MVGAVIRVDLELDTVSSDSFRQLRHLARQVTTGLRNWEFAEIKEGLAESEPTVVSLDRAEVKEGVRAVIRDESGLEKSGTAGRSDKK